MFSISRTSSSLAGTVSRSATHVVKRWKSQKTIEVTLRANVQGLGKPAGRMRNRLYPMRLANYIDRNAQIIHKDNLAEQHAVQNAQEINMTYQQAAKKEKRIVHLQELRNRLQAVPALVFSRAVNEVLPGSKSIFGSVQAEDVLKELKEKHGINVEKDKLTVQGTKIKSVGESWAQVDLGDMGSVKLKIVVERR
ncbi:hypothetical protein BG011_003763 [Mortierella polycephala]|uniref:50S ribosomal protein L9, chloroplastic n=1 Tax=Mortierella polycephala TaxID=41804 RepID=A0A9P6Q494_9FUNG|nr:hypothetical protein BG011_003763 [Mortierella polycephala]